MTAVIDILIERALDYDRGHSLSVTQSPNAAADQNLPWSNIDMASGLFRTLLRAPWTKCLPRHATLDPLDLPTEESALDLAPIKRHSPRSSSQRSTHSPRHQYRMPLIPTDLGRVGPMASV